MFNRLRRTEFRQEAPPLEHSYEAFQKLKCVVYSTTLQEWQGGINEGFAMTSQFLQTIKAIV